MQLTSDQIAGIRQLSSEQFYGPIETIHGSTIYDLLDTLDAKDRRIKELEEALPPLARLKLLAGRARWEEYNEGMGCCDPSLAEIRGWIAAIEALGERS